MKIVIIGAGPTGLGAAYRLNELKHAEFEVFEGQEYPGGLATTLTDKKGFLWDLGGHVTHSHYSYFDQVFNKALEGEYYTHQRESWVFMNNTFIPYPFQNNIRYLSSKELLDCLVGLIRTRLQKSKEPKNFHDWIEKFFGKGIANYFMLPYNRKVWGVDTRKMDYRWNGDRIPQISLARILKNIIFKKDDISWGPNAVFKFPKRGGVGAIWKGVAKMLPRGKIRFNKKIVSVNTTLKKITFEDGTEERYDCLISTIPLDQLLELTDLQSRWKELAGKLQYNSVYIVGLGLNGKIPSALKTKCWLYFSNKDIPFHRTTVFSNYSPFNVPKPGKQWSLMSEVTSSDFKSVDETRLKEEVITAFIKTGIIEDSKKIISIFLTKLPYGYPIPTLERDRILQLIQPVLESRQIYSRGRFGGWKYEVSNMDHSFMQGKEVVDKVLGKGSETVYNFS